MNGSLGLLQPKINWRLKVLVKKCTLFIPLSAVLLLLLSGFCRLPNSALCKNSNIISLGSINHPGAGLKASLFVNDLITFFFCLRFSLPSVMGSFAARNLQSELLLSSGYRLADKILNFCYVFIVSELKSKQTLLLWNLQYLPPVISTFICFLSSSCLVFCE